MSCQGDPRRLAGPGIGCQLALLLICAAPSALAHGRSTLMVLVDPRQPSPISADSFLFGLQLQFHPYDIDIRSQVWQRPATDTDQLAEARVRGARDGADAVIWYVVRQDREPAVIVVYVLDNIGRQTLSESFPLVTRSTAIERTMAVSTRTQLRASLRLRLRLRRRPRSSKRPVIPPRVSRAPPAPVLAATAEPRLQLAVGYEVLGFPVGGEVRHGPVVGARWLPRGRWSLGLGLSLSLPQEQVLPQSTWTRTVLQLGVTLARRWSWPRWEAWAGVRVRGGGGWIEARNRQSARVERATLGEVSLGAAGGVGWRLGGRFSLGLVVFGGGVLLGHTLELQGVTVSRPGSLELGATLEGQVRLW